MDLTTYLQQRKIRIHECLQQNLPDLSHESKSLHKAMHYAVLSGGKRLRPLLLYVVGETLGASIDWLDKPACAVELIHCYSLIHDDLPAMDNDVLRRGLPTCHIAFGEAIAILAGDALQSLAFTLLAETNYSAISPNAQLQAIKILAKSCGSYGMAGGQTLDIEATQKKLPADQIEIIHAKKTGSLIQTCVLIAAHIAGCTDSNQLQNLARFGATLGLAFQIQDDILDIESSTSELGKQQGTDLTSEKATYPTSIGIEPAKQRLRELDDQILEIVDELDSFTQCSLLRDFVKYIMQRTY